MMGWHICGEVISDEGSKLMLFSIEPISLLFKLGCNKLD